MNKEGSAVAALLNEINELKARVRALEATIMPNPRTAREAEEIMETRERIMGHIHTGATPVWIDTREGVVPLTTDVTITNDGYNGIPTYTGTYN